MSVLNQLYLRYTIFEQSGGWHEEDTDTGCFILKWGRYGRCTTVQKFGQVNRPELRN